MFHEYYIWFINLHSVKNKDYWIFQKSIAKYLFKTGCMIGLPPFHSFYYEKQLVQTV